MSKFLPFNLFVRQALLYPLVAPFLPAIANVRKGIKYAAGVLTGTLDTTPPWGTAKTGQTTKYRTGDDGDLEKGYPAAPPRFTDNEDGTITDNASGLMWVKDPSQLGGNFGTPGNPGQMDWEDAIDECLALDYAGHDDWRLPNIKELLSIVDYSKTSGPLIDNAFTCVSDRYWSSSTRAQYTTSSWIMEFDDGWVQNSGKTNTYYLRPVRLGIPKD